LNFKNYFSLFDLKENYSINQQELSNKYIHIQRDLHPDKFNDEDKQLINEVEKYFSFVSQAYTTLKDDYERANYLLKIKEHKFIEEAKNENVSNLNFLEDLMDIQEHIANTNTIDELIKLREDLQNKIKNEKIKIEENFKGNRLDIVLESLKMQNYYTSLTNLIDKRIDSDTFN